MNIRGLLVLLVSLALAGVAAISANRWISTRLAEAETEMVEVIAAANDIPFGATLDATQIKTVPLPRAAIPPNAFTDPKLILGRVASTPLYKGEILIEGRVVEHLGGSALAAAVEEGKRAITVGVNEVIGVGGFMLPGNRVDLISVKNRSGGGSESRTLLENLKVLAVDQTTSPDKKDPVVVRAVTLEVTPEQAEIIARATNEGKVQFTLRNPLDGNKSLPTIAEPEPAPEPVPGQIVDTPPPPPVFEPPPVAVDRRIFVIRGPGASGKGISVTETLIGQHIEQ